MRMCAAILFPAALLAAVCGGSPSTEERVLHLRTGDYTESELRARFRAEWLTEQACRTINGLSPFEVLDIINVNFESDSREIVRTPDANDDLRQAEILIEECERIY